MAAQPVIGLAPARQGAVWPGPYRQTDPRGRCGPVLTDRPTLGGGVARSLQTDRSRLSRGRCGPALTDRLAPARQGDGVTRPLQTDWPRLGRGRCYPALTAGLAPARQGAVWPGPYRQTGPGSAGERCIPVLAAGLAPARQGAVWPGPYRQTGPGSAGGGVARPLQTDWPRPADGRRVDSRERPMAAHCPVSGSAGLLTCECLMYDDTIQ